MFNALTFVKELASPAKKKLQNNNYGSNSFQDEDLIEDDIEGKYNPYYRRWLIHDSWY